MSLTTQRNREAPLPKPKTPRNPLQRNLLQRVILHRKNRRRLRLRRVLQTPAKSRVAPKSGRTRAQRIFERLHQHYPDAKCALEFKNPLQLLVATILSAQSTDKMVNTITPGLFRKYRTAKAFADANTEELEKQVHSCGFFRNKAKSIQGASRILVEKHGGKVPEKMDALLELPGVARKTANVVLGVAFGKAEGVVVDTHVQRLSRRLNFSQQGSPEKIERDLMELFPRDEWILLPHLLIHHGRALCHARKPQCLKCPIEDLCTSDEKVLA
jgi:endonuclease-3